MFFVSSRLLEHVKLPRFFSHCYLQQTMRRFVGFQWGVLGFSLVFLEFRCWGFKVRFFGAEAFGFKA